MARNLTVWLDHTLWSPKGWMLCLCGARERHRLKYLKDSRQGGRHRRSKLGLRIDMTEHHSSLSSLSFQASQETKPKSLERLKVIPETEEKAGMIPGHAI